MFFPVNFFYLASLFNQHEGYISTLNNVYRQQGQDPDNLKKNFFFNLLHVYLINSVNEDLKIVLKPK